MDPRRISPGAWILASASGLAVGLPAGLVLGAPLEIVVGMMLVTPVMLGLTGAVLGTSQWLVLREVLERSWLWIVTSAVGLGMGMTAGVVVVETVGRMITGGQVRLVSVGSAGLAVSFAAIGILGGITMGLAQWLHLRRQTAASAKWIVVNGIALPSGFLAGLLVATLGFGGMLNPAGAICFLLVSGSVYGGMTFRAMRQIRVNGVFKELDPGPA